MGYRKELKEMVRRGRFVHSKGEEGREVRPQLVICCTAGDKNMQMNLKEVRERRRFEGS